MEQEYKKLFQHLKPVEIPANLETLVLARLVKEQTRRAKIRLAGLSSLIVGSVACVPWALNYLTQSFIQSGFYQYLSLIFSDSSVLFNYGQELAISLAESLPIIGLIAFLSVVGVFFWSLVKATKEARIVFLSA